MRPTFGITTVSVLLPASRSRHEVSGGTRCYPDGLRRSSLGLRGPWENRTLPPAPQGIAHGWPPEQALRYLACATAVLTRHSPPKRGALPRMFRPYVRPRGRALALPRPSLAWRGGIPCRTPRRIDFPGPFSRIASQPSSELAPCRVPELNRPTSPSGEWRTQSPSPRRAGWWPQLVSVTRACGPTGHFSRIHPSCDAGP